MTQYSHENVLLLRFPAPPLSPFHFEQIYCPAVRHTLVLITSLPLVWIPLNCCSGLHILKFMQMDSKGMDSLDDVCGCAAGQTCLSGLLGSLLHG